MSSRAFTQSTAEEQGLQIQEHELKCGREELQSLTGRSLEPENVTIPNWFRTEIILLTAFDYLVSPISTNGALVINITTSLVTIQSLCSVIT